ncbi:FAD:protein FMN transferase [Phenylobacterium sp.]|uniref:FAD:protein FMN transferase n=1 Tax=Phenylobacterium sp. TaxID=1871053 RepID=UPI0035B427D0
MRIAVPNSIASAAARPRGGREVRLSGPTMGVSWTVRVLAPDGASDAEIRAAVQSAVDGVVAQMSDWEPESDLSRFNRAPAGSWVRAPADLVDVVQAGVFLATLSEGAFDPTIGALTELWGFGPAGPVAEAPERAALTAACAGWRGLQVDVAGGRLYQPGGLRLDLSGIAKGFGVDRASAALSGLGLRDHLLEIGGELRGEGVKGSGEPWWVDVEPPPGSALEPLRVAAHGLSVATSGDWRRGFEADGRRYSHTLDPRTRAPVDAALAAVTVIHRECMQADALCTALMVLGADAMTFAERHEVAALIVRRSGKGFVEEVTPALQALLD